MEARRLVITEKKRDRPIAIASPADFLTRADSSIEPEEVFRDPKFTLYCFDLEQQATIFVESDDPTAVDKAPFYYQGQAEHAVGLVSMPFPSFHQFAAQTPKPREGYIWIHSVGRCGSTLLSKVLASVPSVHSLSEPDDLSQLAGLWRDGAVSHDEVRELVASSAKWRGKPREGTPFDRVAIKTRSEVLVLADVFGDVFPDDKHLFLYRDGLAWMRTIVRNFSPDREIYDQALNRKMEDGWARILPLVSEYRSESAPMNPVQIRILAWIFCMESYLRLLDLGVSVRAARFEDLTTAPESILRQVLSFCGIETFDWGAIQEVLGRDSQAGTIYDREVRHKRTREMTEDLVQDARDMIASRPRLRVPDVVVPLTLLPLEAR